MRRHPTGEHFHQIETDSTFARVSSAAAETHITSAHHFRPFRARFSLAEAMSVSFSRPHPLAKVPPVS